ncbi:hypothetical protein [Ensifer sp. MJa1]|uniref:hypothetical protein n=1 Tax=Ensifer sp. MJa1 TaxID=2919888 RepID=UPI003009A630
MRILITGFAVAALAVAPCAWDSDPREPSAIAALFGDRVLAAQSPGTIADQGGAFLEDTPNQASASAVPKQ